MQTKAIKQGVVTLVFILLAGYVHGQQIFAHNDYAKPKPFYTAFELKADYIEADVFLHNGVIVVSHDRKDIDPSKTLESMYLKPLLESDLYKLTLIIDLKEQVLEALVKEIEKFPKLIATPGFRIAISGDYPKPSEWSKYPLWVYFDGRPNINYTEDQKKRLAMVSTSFSSVSKWKGQGEIPEPDLAKIKDVITQAHNLNQPVRFWGSPDFGNAWDKLEAIGVDVLNSDKVEELAAHIRN